MRPGFYFNVYTPNPLQITKRARMSFSDKISWVGGMLGLFTGFSLISGLEIIYWLWFKVISTSLILMTCYCLFLIPGASS